MNIRKVSFGLIGAAMFAGALSGCNETKYVDNAKNKAVKYLTGDELLKAERFASQQNNYDNLSGKAITYWDSLLIEAKAKEAYAKGQQVIRDSADGKFFRKIKFKAHLDTVIDAKNVTENSRQEYANYVNAQDFIKVRDNAPDDYHIGYKNSLVGSTHYWNLITSAGRQKEAYEQGMADERNYQKNKHLPNINSLGALSK